MKKLLVGISILFCFSSSFAYNYGGYDNPQNVIDTYIDESNPNQEYSTQGYFSVCGHGGIKEYSLIYFAEEFPGDLNGGVFDNYEITATLNLYKYDTPLLGIKIGAVNWYGWWFDGHLSWSDLPWNPDDQPDVFVEVTRDVVNFGEDVPHKLDVTELVSYWVDNHGDYYGFIIYSPINDDVYADFFSSDNLDFPERTPELIVECLEEKDIATIQTTSLGKVRSLFAN